jgi:hypothetical protein
MVEVMMEVHAVFAIRVVTWTMHGASKLEPSNSEENGLLRWWLE